MRIAIIGNGSIGMFAASRLLSNAANDVQITIFGKSLRPFSASAAAGLMLNIFSEIDDISYQMPLTKWKLDNWEAAISSWDYFFGESGVVCDTTLFTSYGTKIYKNPSTANQLESLSFERQFKIADKYKVVAENSLQSDEFFLPHEHSADARHVLSKLDEFLASKVCFVDDNVRAIHQAPRGCAIETHNNNHQNIYDHVLICAGSKSSDILKNSTNISKPNVQSMNGVGSALLLSSEFDYVASPTAESIVRSPNRGGTCGIHLVQQNQGVYVGASSVVTTKDLQKPRFGSLEALIAGAKNELKLPNVVRLSAECVTGYRPVTQDANPLVGRLSDNVTCCFGHKRDGFTWAPYLSNLLAKIIFDIKLTTAESDYLGLSRPLRSFSSFLSFDESLKLFLLNEKYSSMQHNEEFDELTEKVLTERFTQLHEKSCFSTAVCHPELVNSNYFCF